MSMFFGSPFFFHYKGRYVEVRHGFPNGVRVTFIDKRTQNRYDSFGYVPTDFQKGCFDFFELQHHIDGHCEGEHFDATRPIPIALIEQSLDEDRRKDQP